jgi:hypothetical protein
MGVPLATTWPAFGQAYLVSSNGKVIAGFAGLDGGHEPARLEASA